LGGTFKTDNLITVCCHCHHKYEKLFQKAFHAQQNTKKIKEYNQGRQDALKEELEFLEKMKKTYSLDRAIKRQISIRIIKLKKELKQGDRK